MCACAVVVVGCARVLWWFTMVVGCVLWWWDVCVCYDGGMCACGGGTCACEYAMVVGCVRVLWWWDVCVCYGGGMCAMVVGCVRVLWWWDVCVRGGLCACGGEMCACDVWRGLVLWCGVV